LRKALDLLPDKERAPFWTNAIQHEQDFRSIRHSPAFTRLEKANSPQAPGKPLS
jgi:hypothetical protein